MESTPRSIYRYAPRPQNGSMEHRVDFALEAGTQVSITPFEKDAGWTGEVISFCDDKLSVELGAVLEIGGIVKLETREVWILADTDECQPYGGRFRADLKFLSWISKADLKRIS